MNNEFEKVLERAIDSTKLSEVEKYGYCHLSESYSNDAGQVIKIEVYELESKTYLVRYVDSKCVLFNDITALQK